MPRLRDPYVDRDQDVEYGFIMENHPFVCPICLEKFPISYSWLPLGSETDRKTRIMHVCGHCWRLAISSLEIATREHGRPAALANFYEVLRIIMDFKIGEEFTTGAALFADKTNGQPPSLGQKYPLQPWGWPVPKAWFEITRIGENGVYYCVVTEAPAQGQQQE